MEGGGWLVSYPRFQEHLEGRLTVRGHTLRRPQSTSEPDVQIAEAAGSGQRPHAKTKPCSDTEACSVQRAVCCGWPFYEVSMAVF
jgi:hypothetical protein